MNYNKNYKWIIIGLALGNVFGASFFPVFGIAFYPLGISIGLVFGLIQYKIKEKKDNKK